MRIHAELISVHASQYATTSINHIVHNFQKKSEQYFFCRFSDSSDSWYLANLTVKSRKKLANYCYEKAALNEFKWPSDMESTVAQSTIDGFPGSIELGPRPVNANNLSAHAHLYLPWFYKTLQRIEQKVFAQEPQPQTYASRGYVYRQLKSMTKAIPLPKKVCESLLVAVQQAINNDLLPLYGKKVLSCTYLTVGHYMAFHEFIQQVTTAIKSNSFQPMKFTDPKGARRFTIVPVYSFQQRHIQFDSRTFFPVLRKAGLFRGHRIDEEALRDIFWRNFDFTKIGVEQRENLEQSRRNFLKMRTGRPIGQKNRHNHKAGRPKQRPVIDKNQTQLNFNRRGQASTSSSHRLSSNPVSEEHAEFDDFELDSETMEQLQNIEQAYMEDRPEDMDEEEEEDDDDEEEGEEKEGSLFGAADEEAGEIYNITACYGDIKYAGYSTHYIGKLMNGYAINNYNSPSPQGWNSSQFLVDPYCYDYYLPVFTNNNQPPVYYPDQYQVDLIAAKAKAVIKEQAGNAEPFYLQIASVAPHQNIYYYNNTNATSSRNTTPPLPAKRHANLFPNLKAPRGPNYNPVDQSDKPSYLKTLPLLNKTEEDFLDFFYRQRIRTLQALDELIDDVVGQLEESGVLDNTYIFYTSDNGYHLGQYRVYGGKELPYEEDTNVPFIVRGPNVPVGISSQVVSSHLDLAPTFLDIAGGSIPDFVDGSVIPIHESARNQEKPPSEVVELEFWDNLNMQGAGLDIVTYKNNSYRALRVLAEDYNYFYSTWCTNEHELYELKTDPYQIKNLYKNSSKSLIDRLDALLLVAKDCQQDYCREPWTALHPNGEVTNLKEALDSKYDKYYASLPKTAYKHCLTVQSWDNESPHFPGFTPFSPDGTYQSHPLSQHELDELLHLAETQKWNMRVPVEVKRAYDVLPRPTDIPGAVKSVGDVEKLAVAVPQELLDLDIDWPRYGFYGDGNS
ncbi:hypothetical protein BZG36_00041 [Bifiguratus adelaidae]|uniref:Sulfatase N-terminal domain-containing protein n=1 Tax=Bifiguratus adelaidae TaxID=1938954 RepID=A0A261Y8A1_9FUNG|nr:hypothetical protein BZG36_00041 [Bifiguratus adelaidae]